MESSEGPCGLPGATTVSASTQTEICQGPSGESLVSASTQTEICQGPSGASIVSDSVQSGVSPRPNGSSGATSASASLQPGSRVPEDPCWSELASAIRMQGPKAIQSFIENGVPGDPSQTFKERLNSLLMANKAAIQTVQSSKIVWITEVVFPPNCPVGDYEKFDVKVWRHLVNHPALRQIKCNRIWVEAMCQFRNKIFHAGPQPLSDKDCKDLWEKLGELFVNLGCTLKQKTPSTSGGDQSKDVSNSHWMRLATVVHEHFPRAARRVLETKMFVDQPLVQDTQFLQGLLDDLWKDKKELCMMLSEWEIDLVYPQSGSVNLGSFNIVLWKKIIQHFFPNETWLEFRALPTLADLQAYSSKSSPCSLVDGLFQFRNYIFRSGCLEMSEKEFNSLWGCLEEMLSGLKYDVARISAYKTDHFDCSCPGNEAAQAGQARATAKEHFRMPTIPDDVLAELEQEFPGDEVEELSSLLVVMVSEDGEKYVQVLQTSLAKGKTFFRSTARMLVKDVRKAKSDPWFKNMLCNLWESYLQPFMEGPKHEINFEKALLATAESSQAAEFTLLRVLSKMSPKAAAQLVAYAGKVASSLSTEKEVFVGKHGSRAITHSPAAGGAIVPVALLVAQLPREVLLSLYQWWTGKITGKRCAKVIVDSVSTVVGGVATGAVGMAVGGMVAGPAGVLIAGIVGTVAGCNISNSLSDYLTRNMFDLPNDVALENAYNFLQVKHSDSNDIINKQFQKLCLQYHPDNGGNIEEWHRLQLSMSVIRFARGGSLY